MNPTIPFEEVAKPPFAERHPYLIFTVTWSVRLVLLAVLTVLEAMMDTAAANASAGVSLHGTPLGRTTSCCLMLGRCIIALSWFFVALGWAQAFKRLFIKEKFLLLMVTEVLYLVGMITLAQVTFPESLLLILAALIAFVILQVPTIIIAHYTYSRLLTLQRPLWWRILLNLIFWGYVTIILWISLCIMA